MTEAKVEYQTDSDRQHGIPTLLSVSSLLYEVLSLRQGSLKLPFIPFALLPFAGIQAAGFSPLRAKSKILSLKLDRFQGAGQIKKADKIVDLG